jgi:hypothetical protein
MGCVKILNYNLFDADTYANLFKSSEQASFPVSNIEAEVRRSKVWRSNGYYKVTSSNNAIVFKDASGGGNLTATIATGEYSSTSSFMTAVDTALEAAGAANYTVTQNSALKFVLTSDLSGGATHFELVCTNAGFTAASLLGFSTASNLTGAATYAADYLRINSEEWITLDAGTPINCQAFALLGRRNEVLPISPGATVKLQASYTDHWDAPAWQETLSYDDEVLASISTLGLADNPYRFWRISFVDQNPKGYIEVGSVFLGNAYSPDRGAVQFPFRAAQDDRTTVVYSEGGQSFSDAQEQTQDVLIDWEGLKKDEVEELINIFKDYGKRLPLFVSFDSSAAFSTATERWVKLVKFADDPETQLVSPNNWSCSMRFKEEV